MLPSRAILFVVSLGIVQTNAHFYLNYPTTVGFDDDLEGTAPCGGFDVSFSNVTSFYVGGDSIALTSTHPASTWLFRATLDTKAAGNWSTLLPAIAQQTQGQFCETGVTVPASFAGQQGVIQVIEDAVDGQLFQCGAVNFVSGINPTIPSTCKNATGLTATFTSGAALSSIAEATATAAQSGSSTGTATSSSTSSGASPSISTSASASAIGGYAAESLLWETVAVLGLLVVASNI